MTATQINAVRAREIFDSRGRPTVEAEITLAGGAVGRASAPSGASRGAAEAFELRDGGERLDGLGVRHAVAAANTEISARIAGMDALDQSRVDRAMLDLDGTANLARLGGNAVLAISLAVARAAAAAAGQGFHQRIAHLAGVETPALPTPMVNILSGGLHAGRGMDVQDFLFMPLGAPDYQTALERILNMRTAAAALCAEAGVTTLLADEGGLAPGFARSEDALELMVRAMERAGLTPGQDGGIALDIAASSLAQTAEGYVFAREGRTLGSPALIERLTEWARRWPIVSIEDGLGEEDWEHWPALTQALGGLQLVGDDLFATQPARIRKGAALGAANAVLIKVNQNGCLSGALEAVAAAKAAGYATVISARSGETEDAFLADLAVGLAGGQIKIGSVRNSERMAKYNQLLRLAETVPGFTPFPAP